MSPPADTLQKPGDGWYVTWRLAHYWDGRSNLSICQDIPYRPRHTSRARNGDLSCKECRMIWQKRHNTID